MYEILPKIFLILFGIMGIVIMYTVFTSITSSSCYPDDLYTHDETTNFKVGIFDQVYDTLCSNFVGLNSGLWQFYKNWLVDVSGGQSTVVSFSNSIWNMGKGFCKTHSNYDYANLEGNDAITSSEVLLELFLYESERCWSLFEGKNSAQTASDSKDPIVNIGFFDCAEIIYDLKDGESLSLSRINERINSPNTCSEQSNTPSYDSIYWCAPMEEMQTYWDYKFYETNIVTSGDAVETIISQDYSACLTSSRFNIPTYNTDENGVSLIDGRGKITITYFDYFDWENFWGTNQNIAYDNYPACYYVNTFNDFKDFEEIYYGYEYKNFDQNTLVICFEKYDSPISQGSCKGDIDCGLLNTDLGVNSFCDISESCEETWDGLKHECVISNENTDCEDLDLVECRTNEFSGCEWEVQGSCQGTLTCSKCGISLFGTRSSCDLSNVCKEEGYAPINCVTTGVTCSDLKYFDCLNAECAGCRWVQ